jgi:hypothetical protein
MVEAAHVVAAVLLFGTVLVVDLRLLGLADVRRPFTRISRETLPLVWLAFVVSVITGSLMFAASAQTYFGNTAFRLKALALFGAGLNMLLFQRVTRRHVADWDDGRAAPRAVPTKRFKSYSTVTRRRSIGCTTVSCVTTQRCVVRWCCA